MTGRGRGGFKPKANFGNDTLAQLTNLQGPRSNFEDATVNPVSENVAKKYENLISKILTLNPEDDGILLNQKYKHIIETWEKDCTSEQAVEEALDVIHRRGLYNAAFATKLVNMLSSISFNSVEINNIKIRNQFIAKLQHDFDNCKVMQTKCPTAFRNAVRMLGEFYHKARLSSGKQIQFFVSPLRKYLNMLLESAQEEDLELFAIQLYMNGNGIKSTLPQKLNETLLQVRHLLVNNDRLSATSKIWLLLSLDVANHNFGVLPPELQKFYVSQLGDKAMSQFERINTELTIQTIQKNELLDKIISNVNVLKVEVPTTQWDGNMSKMGGGDSYAAAEQTNTTHVKENFSKSTFENHDGPKPSFGREKYLVKAQTYKKITPDNGAVPPTNLNNQWESSSSSSSNNKRENTPRPILGVGARLQKSADKKADDTNWRDRSSNDSAASSGDWREIKTDLNPTAAGWESKSNKSTSGSGWGNDSKETGKKSWSQHDDRTETDYTNT